MNKALEHDKTLVRHNAYYLLVHFTYKKLTFSPHSTESTREGQVKKWWKWYNGKGFKLIQKLELESKKPPSVSEPVDLSSPERRSETEELIKGFKSPISASKLLNRKKQSLTFTVIFAIIAFAISIGMLLHIVFRLILFHPHF